MSMMQRLFGGTCITVSCDIFVDERKYNDILAVCTSLITESELVLDHKGFLKER